MATMRVYVYPQPVLARKAKAITRIDKEIREFGARLVETMLEADGVGLAAPQVGESIRIIALNMEDRPRVFINPRIVEREGRQIELEGCLSFPRLYGDVVRPEKVVVEATRLNGKRTRIEAEGLMARAFCHEVDHLDGVTFIEKVIEPTLGWLLPDPESEEGLRFEKTSLEEAKRLLTEYGGYPMHLEAQK